MLSILTIIYIVGALGLVLGMASPFLMDWLGW